MTSVPLSKFLEQRLNLLWPYYKALLREVLVACIILCSTRNVVLPNLSLSLLLRTSYSTFIWDSVLCSQASFWTGNKLVFLLLFPSKIMIKVQLLLRLRMGKGETSGNLLLLSGCEAWSSHLKIWMRRAENALCSNSLRILFWMRTWCRWITGSCFGFFVFFVFFF